MRLLLAGVGSTLAAAALIAPAARAATSHAFTASYSGTGAGQARSTRVSGHATATGRGKLIGSSTLAGSASGVVTSPICVKFSGRAVLAGKTGKIKLAASNAQACSTSADASSVAFSGTARVTGGTGKFAGASGTLSFHGRYVRQTGAVTIGFRGRITY